MAFKFKQTVSRHRQGFTLTEAAIVLGVIGLILAGIWATLSWGWENQRQEQAAEEITTVVANVRAAYGGQVGIPTQVTKDTLDPQLIAKNIIPVYMLRNPPGQCSNYYSAGFNGLTDLCADNPWGPAGEPYKGSFEVCNWDLSWTQCDQGNPSGQVFAVALLGLNQSACMALVLKISSGYGPSGLLDVDINNNNIINGRTSTLTGSGSLPVSTSDVSALCQTTDGNLIKFIYRLRIPPS